MKAKISFVGLLAACVFIFTACKKNEITGGGSGGVATLNLSAQHMARDIDSCWIYIKYDATEAPTLTGYDDSALATVKGVGRPLVKFSNLTMGNYFVYARGYDPVYQQPANGGIVVTVDREQEYYVNIPMSVHR